MWQFKRNRCAYDLHNEPVTAVVTAFPLELNALLKRVAIEHTCKHKGVTYYFTKWSGKPCVFFSTGVGPKKAEKAIHKLFSFLPIRDVVVSGIAGAVAPSLAIGDVVVPRVWEELSSGKQVEVDTSMFAVVHNLPGFVVVEKGITTSKFIDKKNGMDGVGIVDMESYPIVYAARQHAVPSIVIKAVSDPSGSEGNDDSFALAGEKGAEATLTFLTLLAGEEQ